MTKNTLSDLNNHLFAQLERLSDETIDQDVLNKEIERSKAISTVAKTIIENAKTSLEGAKFNYENLPSNIKPLDQFRIENND